MTNPPPSDRARLETAANARKAIEWGIATIKEHRAFLTEGQIKALKRIIYNAPEAVREPPPS